MMTEQLKLNAQGTQPELIIKDKMNVSGYEKESSVSIIFDKSVCILNDNVLMIICQPVRPSMRAENN